MFKIKNLDVDLLMGMLFLSLAWIFTRFDKFLGKCEGFLQVLILDLCEILFASLTLQELIVEEA